MASTDDDGSNCSPKSVPGDADSSGECEQLKLVLDYPVTQNLIVTKVAQKSKWHKDQPLQNDLSKPSEFGGYQPTVCNGSVTDNQSVVDIQPSDDCAMVFDHPLTIDQTKPLVFGGYWPTVCNGSVTNNQSVVDIQPSYDCAMVFDHPLTIDQTKPLLFGGYQPTIRNGSVTDCRSVVDIQPSDDCALVVDHPLTIDQTKPLLFGGYQPTIRNGSVTDCRSVVDIQPSDDCALVVDQPLTIDQTKPLFVGNVQCSHMVRNGPDTHGQSVVATEVPCDMQSVPMVVDQPMTDCPSVVTYQPQCHSHSEFVVTDVQMTETVETAVNLQPHCDIQSTIVVPSQPSVIVQIESLISDKPLTVQQTNNVVINEKLKDDNIKPTVVLDRLSDYVLNHFNVLTNLNNTNMGSKEFNNIQQNSLVQLDRRKKPVVVLKRLNTTIISRSNLPRENTQSVSEHNILKKTKKPVVVLKRLSSSKLLRLSVLKDNSTFAVEHNELNLMLHRDSRAMQSNVTMNDQSNVDLQNFNVSVDNCNVTNFQNSVNIDNVQQPVVVLNRMSDVDVQRLGLGGPPTQVVRNPRTTMVVRNPPCRPNVTLNDRLNADLQNVNVSADNRNVVNVQIGVNIANVQQPVVVIDRMSDADLQRFGFVTPATHVVRNPPLRSRLNRAVHLKLTYRKALTFSEQSVQSIPVYSIGRMNLKCRFCSAKFSVLEKLHSHGKTDLFNTCCHFGRVVLPNLGQCPDLLHDLLTEETSVANNFRKHIRTINSNFAMASFNASYPTDRNVDQGAWCFHITGQIYHYVQPIPDPTSGEPLKYNQLYFIDCDDACGRRKEFIGDRVDHDLIRDVEIMLRLVNPLCQAYKTMSQLIAEQNLHNVSIMFKENMSRHLRNMELPSSRCEHAAVFEGPSPPFDVNLIIHPRGSNKSTELKNLNHLADPMVYPLLFPNGESGFQMGMNHVTRNVRGYCKLPNGQESNVTQREFYAYRICERDGFSILHNGQKLYLQYLVDAWCKVEANMMWYLKQNQPKIRSENYKGLHQYVQKKANEMNARIGKLVILPANHVNSPRYMEKLYVEAMTLVARFGKPDLFITFTTNPKWFEIQNQLQFKQRYEFRPDLVCRVFKAKFQEFLNDFTQKQMYGIVETYLYVIEFQKRGLPHAHLLITFREGDKIDVNNVDDMICAEIPDMHDDPDLYELVTEHYVHKPCGAQNPNAPCMRDGQCTKKFPKQFSDETVIPNNARPLYRRRRDGQTIEVDGQTVDNRSIVPYNRYAAKKYQCHINFEVCTSMASMKYLYKYVHKGVDCITIQTSDNDEQVVNWDEIEKFIECRYVNSSEATYRLFRFPTNDRSHSVLTLPVHLENEQCVLFHEDMDERELLETAGKSSKLMAWFDLNKNPKAHDLRYIDVPEFYTWEQKTSCWKERKQVSKQIGRIMEVSPNNVELFHLRLLLRHIPCAKGFSDLRLVNGVQCDTYYDACKRLGLIDNNEGFADCLQEMATFRFSNRLRRVFALICCIAQENQIILLADLFEKFKNDLIEDYLRGGYSHDEAVDRCLLSIQFHLNRNKKDLTDFNLPLPSRSDYNDDDQPYVQTVQEIDIQTLNESQLNVYKSVMQAVKNADNGCHNDHNMFYVDGPAGTGKTYLYNAILNNLRASNKHTIAVAWTGMASTLLTYGTTVHRAFQLPLTLHEDAVAGWPVNHPKSKYVKLASIIVWDEAPMSPKFALEAIDKYLRDLMNAPTTPFGGKVILLGGDFRQVLPVVEHGNRATIIRSSIRSSRLWSSFKQFHLIENMRTGRHEISFSQWLLKIGNGVLPQPDYVTSINDAIELPSDICVKREDDLIAHVFGADLEKEYASGAILCPTNDSAKEINNMIVDKIDSDGRTYLSCDTYCAEPEDSFVPDIEVINSIESSGLPPHELILKKGVVVMLLRNIDLDDGLCNGTRLKVCELHNHCIDCEILVGKNKGHKALIPRISITTNEESLPRRLTRYQFPVKLAFAMTINKSQGQTFKRIAVRLSSPCFAHGQLYVAFSRVHRLDDLRIQIRNGPKQGCVDGKYYTRNIVYKSVLSAMPGSVYNDFVCLETVLDDLEPYIDENYCIEDNLHVQANDDNTVVVKNLQTYYKHIISPSGNSCVIIDHYNEVQSSNLQEDLITKQTELEQLFNIQNCADEFILFSTNDSIKISKGNEPGTSGICKVYLHRNNTDSDDNHSDII